MNHATGNYSADVNLAPGFALTNTWDPIDEAWYWAGLQDRSLPHLRRQGNSQLAGEGPDGRALSCACLEMRELRQRPDRLSTGLVEQCLPAFLRRDRKRQGF